MDEWMMATHDAGGFVGGTKFGSVSMAIISGGRQKPPSGRGLGASTCMTAPTPSHTPSPRLTSNPHTAPCKKGTRGAHAHLALLQYRRRRSLLSPSRFRVQCHKFSSWSKGITNEITNLFSPSFSEGQLCPTIQLL